MIKFKNFIVINLFLIIVLVSTKSFSDDHNVMEILELIQKDIKTLEKAVYSSSTDDNFNSSTSSSSIDQNTEDVLTRHLLKLSEIENQFQKLTNKFEEINFKIDKLSSRISKVQADNQLRFQQIEKTVANTISSKAQKLNLSATNSENEKIFKNNLKLENNEGEKLRSLLYLYERDAAIKTLLAG